MGQTVESNKFKSEGERAIYPNLQKKPPKTLINIFI